MFIGKNILPGFPEELTIVVNYLNEKAALGLFSFSDSFLYWEDNESIVDSLELKLDGGSLYFAVSLAYIASLNDGIFEFPEDTREWRWAWSLNLLAEYAEWTPTLMRNVILSFPCREDGIERLMNNAAHTYGRKSFDNALTLLAALPDYQHSIKAGLMENDFEKYCSVFPPQDDPDGFGSVFAQTLQLGDVCYGKAFDIAQGFLSFTSSAAMEFYLKAHSNLDDERKRTCEEIVRGMLSTDDTLHYVSPVTNWAYCLRESSPFLECCVISLVKGLGQENSSALTAIDHAIAFKHCDPEFIKKLILEVAENMGPMNIGMLELCLHNLSEKPDDFLDLTLWFVLHPKGLFRIAGRRLWDEYHLENSEFNAADLEEPLQLFFIMSMLQDYGNPETRLPKVLPLLNLKSEKVKAFLMNNLHPYIDEYMGHVSNVIDRLGLECEEANIIKRYVDEREDLIKARREMKELSPIYTDEKVFQEAMRQQSEYTKEIIKESENRHKTAWMDLLAKVVLARAGGWREEDGTIRHLPVMSFTTPSRMMSCSMSPKEQAEWIDQLSKDWDDTTGNH